jgi:hypothetical protein
MPDIFDQIQPTKDIFDRINPTKTPVLGDLQPRIAKAGTDFVPTSPSPARIQGGEIATTAGTAIPQETEFQELARKVGFKGREIVDRARTTEPKQFKGFRSETADALARGLINTTAGGLDALERAAQSSAFEPGLFSNVAEILREIGKDADIQAAVLPKNAGKLKKAGAFVANAVGETLPFMAASVGSTVLTGTPMAAFATSFTVEGENARQEALAAGASEEEADNEAFIVGTINGALESLQVDEVLRFSGVGKASKEAFIEAVKKKSLAKLAKAGKELTLAAAKTAVTEGIQEGLQETTSLLVPGLSGRELPSPEEAFKRIGQAALGGAVVGPILGGVGGAISSGQDIIPGEVEPEPTTTPDGIPLVGTLTRDTTPTVGEEIIETPILERESDGKLDEERDIQSRTRPGQIQEEQRIRPAEAEDALEDQEQEEVASEQGVAAEVAAPARATTEDIIAQRRASRLEAVQRQAEQRKASRDAAVEREAKKIANANKRPVFIQEGRILSREPAGDFVTVQPEVAEAKPLEAKQEGVVAVDKPLPKTKVVDEEGNPQVVFKGMLSKDWKTGEPITEINSVNGPWAGFFTSDRKVADGFKESFATMGDAEVVEATIDMQNPLVIDAKGRPAKDFMFDNIVFGEGSKIEAIKAFEDGHDGIIIKNTSDEGDVFVPKDPSQIHRISPTPAAEKQPAKPKKPVTKEPQKPVATKKPTPAVKQARDTVAKSDPTAFVSAKTPEIKKQIDQVIETDFTTKKPLDLTSPRQADIAADREALGKAAINSKSRRGWNKAQKIAKKQLIPSKADDIAKEILAAPVENMGDVRTAGLTIRMAELKKEHKLATRQLKAAKKKGDDAEIATRAADRNRILEKLDTLQRAVDLSGSEAGRTLAAQKLQINEDFDLESTLLNALSAKKAKLSSREKFNFEKLTESLDKLTAKIDTVFASNQLDKARRFVKKGRGRAATEFKSLTKEQRQSEIAQRMIKTREMLKQGCNN